MTLRLKAAPGGLQLHAAVVIVRVTAAVVALVILTGCAQKVYVRANPGGRVMVDGEDLGSLGPDDVAEVDIGPGISPVPYQLSTGGNTFDGKIERSGFSVPLVLAAVTGALLCVPGCALAGCCAANPQMLSTPIIGVIAALNGCTGAFNSTYGCCAIFFLGPGWLTAPATCAGFGTGALPLSLFGVRSVPESVVLTPSGAFGIAEHKTRPPPAQRETVANLDARLEDGEMPF